MSNFISKSMLENREKLYEEVWREPLTTVAKRYGISDNGLRKRCMKLEIPLPPQGHWAKVQAGKEVPEKPVLPPLKLNELTGITSESSQNGSCYNIKFIDVTKLSDEEILNTHPMDLLSHKSKEEFLEWCRKITVPKKIDVFESLIIEHQNEIKYRKERDKEHKYYDYTKFMPRGSKIPYRNNTAVIPVCVSDKECGRAYRIVDTLIRSIKYLGGRVNVQFQEQDNAKIHLFRYEFTFKITERRAKRRSFASDNSPDKEIRSLRPVYEELFNGCLVLEFRKYIDYWQNYKAPEFVAEFEDKPALPLENQLGEVFLTLFNAAGKAKIEEIIKERENVRIINEQQRHKEIEEENQRAAQVIENKKLRKQNLIDNIEQHMENWSMSRKLREYAKDLEEFALTAEDMRERELLAAYITLVIQKAEGCDPVKRIIDEVQGIGEL